LSGKEAAVDEVEDFHMKMEALHTSPWKKVVKVAELGRIEKQRMGQLVEPLEQSHHKKDLVVVVVGIADVESVIPKDQP
jgi:hypothetical protein